MLNTKRALSKRRREMAGRLALLSFCEILDCDWQQLVSRRRSATHCRDRFLAARFLRRQKFSYPVIGAVLGGRDHSTIIHACRKGL